MTDYDNIYIKTSDDPAFWMVIDGKRYKLNSMNAVYQTGLLPVKTISQDELDAIPIGEKKQSQTAIQGEGLASINTFKSCYQDETMWVVGAGPSIENLRATHFKGGPVVAINYAIEYVEALELKNDIFSMQKDRCFVQPKSAILLVHERESRMCFGNYRPQYVFDNPDDFDLEWYRPSDVTCVAIAKLFGCNQVIYLCCDASANSTVGSVRDGEFVIPDNAGDLLAHRAMIEELAYKLKIAVKFVTPKKKEPKK